MSIDVNERIARHEARMARMDRHIQELRSFMAADCEDEIENAQRAADEALARGRQWEHQWHLDRIADMTERLEELRAPVPKRAPLVFPAPARDAS